MSGVVTKKKLKPKKTQKNVTREIANKSKKEMGNKCKKENLIKDQEKKKISMMKKRCFSI